MRTIAGWVPQLRMTCPYCYERFYRWQILFQCSGKPSRTNTTCTPGPDQTYAARFGDVAQLPVFAARQRRETVHAPCSERTTRRVCPHCHHRLPSDFERVHSRMVAVVGARDSGKTAMLTVLMEELNGRIGDRLGLAVWISDEETRRAFVGYKQVIYGDHSVPEATRPLGTQGTSREPLVFTIAERRRKGKRARRTLLSFFDTAGEDLRTKEGVERNAQYLRSADAVLLLLDPLQTEGGRESAPAAAVDATPADAFAVLQRLTELVQEGRRTLRVRKPMAVALSKIDIYWDQLDPLSPLRIPEPKLAGYAHRDGEAVEAEAERLLREWDGRRILDFVSANYTRHHYFGFSALGHQPTDLKLSEAGVRPYRVADPFLWLLTQLGAARTIRKR